MQPQDWQEEKFVALALFSLVLVELLLRYLVPHLSLMQKKFGFKKRLFTVMEQDGLDMETDNGIIGVEIIPLRIQTFPPVFSWSTKWYCIKRTNRSSTSSNPNIKFKLCKNNFKIREHVLTFSKLFIAI